MEGSISGVEDMIQPGDITERVEDGMEEPPDWLPDGWIMEVICGDNGALYQNFICPVSGARFRMKAEVLNFLFSEMDEHHIESKESTARSMLPKTHEWLPKGWVLEIRSGGEKMDKMYKFYVYKALGVRLFSKEDVLLYIREMKISKYDTDGKCDTSSPDNILAEVQFNPCGLPPGWVKELVYRKKKDGSGMRKDPYFTDPIKHYVFRTVKAAVRYLETGETTRRSFTQRTSVHELYNFEKSADLHESLYKRVTLNMKADKAPASSSLKKKRNCSEETSYSSEDMNTSTGSVSPDEQQEIKKENMKINRREANSSQFIKRRRGRPSKVANQTNGKTNGRDAQIEQEESMVKNEKSQV